METANNNPASVPNPALEVFSVFIGEWKTVGTHPQLPGVTLGGHTSFNWIEGGAFMIMHSSIDDGKIPAGVAIFGSDNSKNEYFMIYFDERKVSRKYDVEFEDNVLKWWRHATEFSQRYTFTFSDNNNTILGTGEMCENGMSWQPDLTLTYTRIQ